MADLDLDIFSAKVQTLGDDVVDSFYIRDSEGQKILDEAYLSEIEKGKKYPKPEKLLRGDPMVLRDLGFSDDERPLGAQVAVRELERLPSPAS